MKKPKRIIVYDLETNGRSTLLDRILEVYMLVYDTDEKKIVKEYHSLVQIEFNHVHLYVYCKTGWTRDYLNEHGRSIADVITDVHQILKEEENTIVSGYNIRQFDNKFLQKYFRRYELPSFDFERKSFDCYIDQKAHLLGMKKSRCPKNWQDIHDRIIVNHYNKQISEMGHKMALQDTCTFYGISVDQQQQHHAKYDTMLAFEILKRQRPDWIKK